MRVMGQLKTIVFSMLIGMLVLLFMPVCFSMPEKAMPVVIDTDLGFDDWIALVVMLDAPSINTRAIIISGAGGVHLKPGMKSLSKFLNLMGKQSIPIAPGLVQPLKYHYEFPAALRVQADNLMSDIIQSNNFKVTSKTQRYDKKSPMHKGINLLYQSIVSSATPVTVVILGPSTDIAYLIKKHPDVKSHIKKLIIMGGAIHTKGNLYIPDFYEQPMNDKAEWNIFFDVKAAQIVLNSRIPKVLIPLDASNSVGITNKFIHALPHFKNYKNSIGLQLIYSILHQVSLSQPVDGNLFFWDVLPAMLVTSKHVNWVASKCYFIKVHADNKQKDMFGVTQAEPCYDHRSCTKTILGIDQLRFHKALMARLHAL